MTSLSGIAHIPPHRSNDPNFVGDLRNGREPRSAIVERVRRFMAAEQVAS